MFDQWPDALTKPAAVEMHATLWLVQIAFAIYFNCRRHDRSQVPWL